MQLIISIIIIITILYFIGGVFLLIGELLDYIGNFISEFWDDISTSIEKYGISCGIIVSLLISISLIIYCLIIGEDNSLFSTFYREDSTIRSSTKLLFIVVPIIILLLFTLIRIGRVISVWIISIILTGTTITLVLGILTFIGLKIYEWIMV